MSELEEWRHPLAAARRQRGWSQEKLAALLQGLRFRHNEKDGQALRARRGARQCRSVSAA